MRLTLVTDPAETTRWCLVLTLKRGEAFVWLWRGWIPRVLWVPGTEVRP